MDLDRQKIDLDRARGVDLGERLRKIFVDPPRVVADDELLRYLARLDERLRRVAARGVTDECLVAAGVLRTCGHHDLARKLLTQAAQILMVRGFFREADRLHEAFYRAQRCDRADP